MLRLAQLENPNSQQKCRNSCYYQNLTSQILQKARSNCFQIAARSRPNTQAHFGNNGYGYTGAACASTPYINQSPGWCGTHDPMYSSVPRIQQKNNGYTIPNPLSESTPHLQYFHDLTNQNAKLRQNQQRPALSMISDNNHIFLNANRSSLVVPDNAIEWYKKQSKCKCAAPPPMLVADENCKRPLGITTGPCAQLKGPCTCNLLTEKTLDPKDFKYISPEFFQLLKDHEKHVFLTNLRHSRKAPRRSIKLKDASQNTDLESKDIKAGLKICKCTSDGNICCGLRVQGFGGTLQKERQDDLCQDAEGLPDINKSYLPPEVDVNFDVKGRPERGVQVNVNTQGHQVSNFNKDRNKFGDQEKFNNKSERKGRDLKRPQKREKERATKSCCWCCISKKPKDKKSKVIVSKPNSHTSIGSRTHSKDRNNKDECIDPHKNRSRSAPITQESRTTSCWSCGSKKAGEKKSKASVSKKDSQGSVVSQSKKTKNKENKFCWCCISKKSGEKKSKSNVAKKGSGSSVGSHIKGSKSKDTAKNKSSCWCCRPKKSKDKTSKVNVSSVGTQYKESTDEGDKPCCLCCKSEKPKKKKSKVKVTKKDSRRSVGTQYKKSKGEDSKPCCWCCRSEKPSDKKSKTSLSKKDSRRSVGTQYKKTKDEDGKPCCWCCWSEKPPKKKSKASVSKKDSRRSVGTQYKKSKGEDGKPCCWCCRSEKPSGKKSKTSLSKKDSQRSTRSTRSNRSHSKEPKDRGSKSCCWCCKSQEPKEKKSRTQVSKRDSRPSTRSRSRDTKSKDECKCRDKSRSKSAPVNQEGKTCCWCCGSKGPSDKKSKASISKKDSRRSTRSTKCPSKETKSRGSKSCCLCCRSEKPKGKKSRTQVSKRNSRTSTRSRSRDTKSKDECKCLDNNRSRSAPVNQEGKTCCWCCGSKGPSDKKSKTSLSKKDSRRSTRSTRSNRSHSKEPKDRGSKSCCWCCSSEKGNKSRTQVSKRNSRASTRSRSKDECKNIDKKRKGKSCCGCGGSKKPDDKKSKTSLSKKDSRRSTRSTRSPSKEPKDKDTKSCCWCCRSRKSKKKKSKTQVSKRDSRTSARSRSRDTKSKDECKDIDKNRKSKSCCGCCGSQKPNDKKSKASISKKNSQALIMSYCKQFEEEDRRRERSRKGKYNRSKQNGSDGRDCRNSRENNAYKANSNTSCWRCKSKANKSESQDCYYKKSDSQQKKTCNRETSESDCDCDSRARRHRRRDLSVDRSKKLQEIWVNPNSRKMSQSQCSCSGEGYCGCFQPSSKQEIEKEWDRREKPRRRKGVKLQSKAGKTRYRESGDSAEKCEELSRGVGIKAHGYTALPELSAEFMGTEKRESDKSSDRYSPHPQEEQYVSQSEVNVLASSFKNRSNGQIKNSSSPKEGRSASSKSNFNIGQDGGETNLGSLESIDNRTDPSRTSLYTDNGVAIQMLKKHVKCVKEDNYWKDMTTNYPERFKKLACEKRKEEKILRRHKEKNRKLVANLAAKAYERKCRQFCREQRRAWKDTETERETQEFLEKHRKANRGLIRRRCLRKKEQEKRKQEEEDERNMAKREERKRKACLRAQLKNDESRQNRPPLHQPRPDFSAQANAHQRKSQSEKRTLAWQHGGRFPRCLIYEKTPDADDELSDDSLNECKAKCNKDRSSSRSRKNYDEKYSKPKSKERKTKEEAHKTKKKKRSCCRSSKKENSKNVKSPCDEDDSPCDDPIIARYRDCCLTHDFELTPDYVLGEKPKCKSKQSR